ncbi:MAG: 2-oxoacid:ferredoxin oxidoreductase subunit beta [Candidatus Bathyarchaeota archaeon]|nr:MAG: 2-oxoacid:ferredoxin oxidoreductase subunit beta [Candidatus Bathyarchaeota archaeon]
MAFKKALVQLDLDRDQVVLVSGIGCHGKMVNYVNVNGFHGIHGRVLPLATGVELANPNLIVVGFAGDADCYDEGWGHFSHAIRKNINITLIVHNNMVLGLTTGQATATSQRGFKTKSTPFGSIPPPLNPIAHALVSNGTFVARGYSGDMTHLTGLIVEAVKHRGFAFLDVFQPCVTFNYLNTHNWFKEKIYKLEEEGHDYTSRQKALEKSLEWGDRIPIGILYREDKSTYRDGFPHVRGVSLTKILTEDVDINPLLERMM